MVAGLSGILFAAVVVVPSLLIILLGVFDVMDDARFDDTTFIVVGHVQVAPSSFTPEKDTVRIKLILRDASDGDEYILYVDQNRNSSVLRLNDGVPGCVDEHNRPHLCRERCRGECRHTRKRRGVILLIVGPVWLVASSVICFVCCTVVRPMAASNRVSVGQYHDGSHGPRGHILDSAYDVDRQSSPSSRSLFGASLPQCRDVQNLQRLDLTAYIERGDTLAHVDIATRCTPDRQDHSVVVVVHPVCSV